MKQFFPLGCVCLLSACTTTGDPRSGGLFGWRESQAKERQEALHREINETEADTRRQTGEYTYLKGARDDAAKRVAELNKVYTALLAENAELRARVQSLAAQHERASENLAHLQKRLQQDEVGTAAAFDNLDSDIAREQWVTRLRQQNLQMRQALDL